MVLYRIQVFPIRICFIFFQGLTLLTITDQVLSDECPPCSCTNTNALCTNKNGLDYIPELPNTITHLIFTGNNLSNFNNHTVTNLTELNLTSLILKHNNIHTISKDAFSSLKHLHLLDLGGNGRLTIYQVADALSGLGSSTLCTVILNSLNWNEEPSLIYEALSIKRFRITKLLMSRNAFKMLNVSSLGEHLPDLEHLDVSFNVIEKLISGHLYRLKRLDMLYNYIEIHNDTFGIYPDCYFPNLTTLNLKSNFVNYFEHRFTCLENLQKLVLDKNPIKRILNNTFSNLTSLQQLSLTHIGTRLYEIQRFAFNIPTLKNLNFSGNEFHFSSENKEDQYFYADYIFKDLQQLEVLDLSDNVFNLSNDNLLKMLTPLKNLRNLTIKHCAFTTIPSNIFHNMTNLQMLDLSENHIESWNGTEVFENSSSIQILKLSKNYISILNESSFPRPLTNNLTLINLAVNPFSCSCKILWFRKWIEEKPKLFEQYPDKYVCKTPVELHHPLLKDYFPSDKECESINTLLIVTTTLSLIGIFAVMLASLVYKGRWHIRYAICLHRVKKKGYSAIEECESFRYSGFVVYCDEDRKWVINKFVKMMESDSEIRLCIHHRNFQVGKLIVDNIADSIAQSKKVILILSRAMIESDWCLFEMRLAHKKFLNREESLLIIMLEHFPKKDMPYSLQTLVSVSTYIEWPDDIFAEDHFWAKVRTAMKDD